MLTGQNGILSRAGEAKEKTEYANLKEETSLIMQNRAIEKSTVGTTSKTLKQDLEAGISNGQVEEITKIDGTSIYTDVCYVTKNGKSITVYEDGEVLEGKVSIWKGATDKECPEFKKDETTNVWNWYIYTAGQLKFLADFVNNGDGTTLPEGLTNYVTEAGYDPSTVTMTLDTTIYLMNNLDLGARPGDGTTDEEKWETNPDELKWMPIGIDYNNVQDKLGTFEGNNYTICGVYVNRNANYNGIFGSSNTIKDLTIRESYIHGGGCTGGIVGISFQKIENNHNKNTIVFGVRICGGIVGVVSGDIEKCTNYAKVIGNDAMTGGILGSMNGSRKIINCINNGEVVGNGTYTGGIIGYPARINITLNECINNGNIMGKNLTGGIVGAESKLIQINKCVNNGAIVGNGERIGGIIGQEGIGTLVKECINEGTITGESDFVGGIAGINFGKIENCNNKGNISAVQGNRVGGIVGESQGNISSCNNNGIVEANDGRIGGIVGQLLYSLKVEDCNNRGQVIGKEEDTGGIVGIILSDGNDPSDKAPTVISKCYNSGKIQGNASTGGIIGGACQYKSLIEKCYNLGEVNGTGDSTGGIVGNFGRSSQIFNCYNMNKVTGINYVGGIAGNSYNSACEIKNCYNIGNISGTTKLGGILGRNSNSSTIENSYYLEGTASLDEGSGLAKSKEFITQDFVTTANATETIWKVEAGKNDGWPILNE